MRGFNIGDKLITSDKKHSGIVTKIETVHKNDEWDFEITINEGHTTYTDSIHNFIII